MVVGADCGLAGSALQHQYSTMLEISTEKQKPKKSGVMGALSHEHSATSKHWLGIQSPVNTVMHAHSISPTFQDSIAPWAQHWMRTVQKALI